MRNILRLFFKAEGINPWIILVCLLTASTIEAIGFASLVPLLLVATNTGSNELSPLLDIARDALARLGLSLDVGPLLGFFIATLILRSLLSFAAMQHVGKAVAEFTARLRLRLIRNLFRARWSYLVHQPVGRLTHAISGQTGQAAQAYQLAATFLAQTLQTIGYLAVAFVVSWPLALVAIGIGGLMAWALNFLVRIARKAGWKRTQRSRELVTLLVDSLNNVKPLRTMAKETEYIAFLEGKIDSITKAIRRQIVSQEALKNGNEMLAAICLGGGFFVAIAIWQVPLVELVVVGILLKRTSNGIAKIQQLFQKAVTVESPYLEASALMAEAADAAERNPGRRPAALERVCRLEEVAFAHGSKEVLDSASIEIPVGCVTVLTGPSGAGKTTIADIILGLYSPARGRVLLDDVPLEEIDLQSWRRMIGYVPQELVLLHDSVYANVTMGNMNIDEAEVWKVLETAGASTFVRALPAGLMTTVGQSGAKLSGGQRQRIALARALLSRPRLLVLDETTSALDPATEREICASIRNLAKESTVLAITHRPAFFDIADRVYRVEDQGVLDVSSQYADGSARPILAPTNVVARDAAT